MKKNLWICLFLLGCRTPEPQNPSVPVAVTIVEEQFTWALLISKEYLADEIDCQRQMAIDAGADPTDPRIEIWAAESACNHVASLVAELPGVSEPDKLDGIAIITVRGPKRIEIQLQRLVQDGLVEYVAVIDGPGIEPPQH